VDDNLIMKTKVKSLQPIDFSMGCFFMYNQAMAKIEVKQIKGFPNAEFAVRVAANTITHHKVIVAQDYYQKLTGGSISAEKLVEKSFEFLLSREPNTSILSEFNLKVIASYFPEYEQEMS
jgi:hypothetical protein